MFRKFKNYMRRRTNFGLVLMSVFTSAKALSTTSNRGSFIVFEGIDRCGKSTQVGLLTKFLTEKGPVEAIRFPDRTSVIGTMINSYLTSSTDMSDETIHLLFSANRWEASQRLRERLESGCTLICDRYAYSGVAFSSAKGLDVDWCRSPDVGLPAPDAVIYLDIPVEDAADRGNYGEERYEKVDFQIKIRDKFMSLREKDGDQISWHVLDARKSIEELHEEIKAIAASVGERVATEPLRSLWKHQ